MLKKYTFIIEKDIESGKYIGSVPHIKGAHTYANSLDELKQNLSEVLALCLSEMPQEDKEIIPEFEGISQVEVSIWVS